MYLLHIFYSNTCRRIDLHGFTKDEVKSQRAIQVSGIFYVESRKRNGIQKYTNKVVDIHNFCVIFKS